MNLQRTPLLLLACTLLSCAGPEKQKSAPREIPVFYGTNQKLTHASNPEQAFANTDDGDPRHVIYGEARVSIPANHREGSQSGVHIERYVPISMTHRDYFSAVNRAYPGVPPNILLLYVHGFNNNFADAAKRAAVFAADLHPNTPPSALIYSWPSADSLFAYSKDEDSIERNQQNLRRFLFSLNGLTHPRKTVLIGHSLGCRALTYAMHDLLLDELHSHGSHVTPLFDELIFIEPDVDADYFKQNLSDAKLLCRRITIYIDGHDLALKASRIIHQYPWLGLSANIEAKGLDIVDASAARDDLLGHSYDGPLFFTDVGQLLNGRSASQRTDLAREGDIYRLRKSR